jgi:cytochrome c biogenesis protein CcmG/thiol:disulfide interchange protein DsbE
MEERDLMSQRWHVSLGHRARLWLMVAASAAVGVAAVSIALGVSSGAGAGARAVPAARNFTVPVLGQPGRRLSLSQYAGRPVIVNFFASWCTPCQHETPLLARFYRSGHGRISVIGIDVNDPAGAALAFVRKTGVAYPVGVDAPPMPTAAAYNVSGLPQTFFLNARHEIVKRVFGALTGKELTTDTAMIAPRAK